MRPCRPWLVPWQFFLNLAEALLKLGQRLLGQLAQLLGELGQLVVAQRAAQLPISPSWPSSPRLSQLEYLRIRAIASRPLEGPCATFVSISASLGELGQLGEIGELSGTLSDDQLAKLTEELSKLTEETLPQLEERLRQVEEELAKEQAKADKDA